MMTLNNNLNFLPKVVLSQPDNSNADFSPCILILRLIAIILLQGPR